MSMTVARRGEPYAQQYARRLGLLAREPRSIREGIALLRWAVTVEGVDRLHVNGVEAEQGLTARGIAQAIADGRELPRVDAGGSHLGTPRWSHDFRTYITGGPFGTDVSEDGVTYWLRPLASSIARMDISSSGADRLAARTVHALPFHRYNVRETWTAQCGRFADPAIADAAEAWAADALRRWWGFYTEMPRGKLIAA
ncbi:MAG: hypothetical protein AMXMBFR46_28200 [Acidimicrobiia bacterium]